ncbi:MAG: ribosomal RNA small subunit methyltransferase A [Deltaproteobacteria bacterium CG11_big_fil_rev_8_21_14_0_20_45_16]|nr:MAG: ribosomal RNA small subunit methyltransferase A [Deltaproteobacteria bacterium CG11_big_fil_rev_8_21_14_0_20_45_16]
MARAKFGQNFLVDKIWQERIVNWFQPKGDFAEIGPGQGALTRLLEKRFNNFCVFEVDPKMQEYHTGKKNYEFILQDFLDWNFELHSKAVNNFSLIGNLPYESGTAIVKQVVYHCDQIDYFLFMLQKEVADRMCSLPRRKSYGSLSVFFQSQYDFKIKGNLPPGAFRPAPKVFSSLIEGHRRQRSPHPTTREYFEFIQSCFQMKRKTLRNVLKNRLSAPQIDEIYKKFEWNSNIRAEEIEIDFWPKVYEEVLSV